MGEINLNPSITNTTTQDVSKTSKRSAVVLPKDQLTNQLAKECLNSLGEAQIAPHKPVLPKLPRLPPHLGDEKADATFHETIVKSAEETHVRHDAEVKIAESNHPVSRPKISFGDTLGASVVKGPKVETAYDKLVKETHVEPEIFNKRLSLIQDISKNGWKDLDAKLKNFTNESVKTKEKATTKFEETANGALQNAFKKDQKTLKSDIKNETQDFKTVYLNSADVVKDITSNLKGLPPRSETEFLQNRKTELERLPPNKRSDTVLSYIDKQISKNVGI